MSIEDLSVGRGQWVGGGLSEGQWSVGRFQYGRRVSGLWVGSNLVAGSVVGGSMVGGRWVAGQWSPKVVLKSRYFFLLIIHFVQESFNVLLPKHSTMISSTVQS